MAGGSGELAVALHSGGIPALDAADQHAERLIPIKSGVRNEKFTVVDEQACPFIELRAEDWAASKGVIGLSVPRSTSRHDSQACQIATKRLVFAAVGFGYSIVVKQDQRPAFPTVY